MDKNEFDTLLDKYLSGTATEEEELLIEQWYAAIDNEAASAGKVEKGLTKRRVWKGVQKHVRDRAMPGKGVHRSLGLPWTMGIAAVLAAAIVAYIYLAVPETPPPGTWLSEGRYQQITNAGRADSTVQLSDGSHISLRPGSVLQVAGSFGKTNREVYLVRGEAFFEVTRDASKPFYVYTHHVVTRVLGTSFTVNARRPDVIVAVRTGRVTVSAMKDAAGANSRDSVILTPNQQAIYHADQGTLLRQLVQEPLPLVADRAIDELYFDGAGAAEIFDALTDAYCISIVYDPQALASCRLTTSINSHDSLYERLDIICDAIGATYRVNGVTITIDSPGCR